jgi:signal transduction histidine kinase
MNDEKKYTVLYVDDEESNLRIFKNTFRRDYNILTATSGKEGLAMLEQQDIDLILSDQRMPGMSGIDFLKQAIDKYPDLNRILVTAYTDYDILREAVNKLKIFQYVEKPWNEDDVKTTIDSALEVHRLKTENQILTSSLIENNDELKRINEELNEEIDKHKKTQLELVKENEYAERCNMLKTAFLANMSHEIRTPMNSIVGFSGLIGDPDVKPESKVEFIGIIQKSCSQLLNIVNDIIEISKIETGNVELKLKTVEVKPMIERYYKTFLIEANKKGLELKIDLGNCENNVCVMADEPKLEQIFTNLIANAIKFTHQGSIVLQAKCIGDVIQF